MVQPEIRLLDVVKTYRTGGVDHTVLDGLSAEIMPGERVALLGRSGSGKSTLLNLLGGLDRVTTGSIEAHGRRLDQLSLREMAHYRRSTVGMIFQGYNLLTPKSAVENVEIPAILSGVPKRKRREQAAEALAAVGLGERLDHRPTELSGGEQQRGAIARALVNRPRVLLADEPTGNLDSATATDVMELINGLVREQSITVILVTHDEDIAEQYSDRVLHIVDGRLANATELQPRVRADGERAAAEEASP